ncbi:hypothetical protein IQ266_18290 [filamentous cyanobacterium LEGE 11480]|uniref:Uncharacterized protein n=1 Tax=Romeriopsis navalis LEGE 11480 TaxID=2777977 RepID=A0A928VNA9_9CYAN|nr:hypothetical protein [Romeriopsis navalis]MBE9031686.1 hypothetical protein [Romeriopsis navalis LEGE 11480]
MTQYTIPEFPPVLSTSRISNNRRAVILQMTEVGLQELYFGRVKSALDSFKIIFGLLIGGRPSDML